MDQLNQHSGISILQPTPINHPPHPAQRADSISDSFSMRVCELFRCAELTLHLSLALGAQPHFTTDLRSAHSQHCIEPTLCGNDEEKGKTVILLSPGLTSDKKPQEM